MIGRLGPGASVGLGQRAAASLLGDLDQDDVPTRE